MVRGEFKGRLETLGVLRRLHARFRSLQMKSRYKATEDYYDKPPLLGTFDGLLNRRAGERLLRVPRNRKPPRIFYLGTDGHQDGSGLLQALQHLGSLSYFRRENGEYGQAWASGRAFAEARAANSWRLLQLFEALAREGSPPDILLGQMWGSRISAPALGEIRRRYGTIIVSIAMDDRHAYRLHQETGTHALIPYIDVAATAAPECVTWYFKEGCPALFFPEASDPGVFRPMPELPQEHDVSFVGGRYGIRDGVVNALRQGRIQLSAYGNGWGDGRLETEEVTELFARSKIVLGIGTIGHCRDFYSLKIRDFDGPMSGSFYLTHANSDLNLVYRVGEEIETYSSVKQCVQKAKRYLRDDPSRECIARMGRDRASRDHTWENRFKVAPLLDKGGRKLVNDRSHLKADQMDGGPLFGGVRLPLGGPDEGDGICMTR